MTTITIKDLAKMNKKELAELVAGLQGELAQAHVREEALFSQTEAGKEESETFNTAIHPMFDWSVYPVDTDLIEQMNTIRFMDQFMALTGGWMAYKNSGKKSKGSGKGSKGSKGSGKGEATIKRAPFNPEAILNDFAKAGIAATYKRRREFKVTACDVSWNITANARGGYTHYVGTAPVATYETINAMLAAMLGK